MFASIAWLEDKKFSCKKIYPHFFVMGDLAIHGNSYSSYSKYCRGPRKTFRSGALGSYRMLLAKVNVVAL